MSPDSGHKIAPSASPLVIWLGAGDAGDVIRDTGRPPIEQAAHGRTAVEGIRFAELMFGLCPCAHVAAFLQAAEMAKGLTLNSRQRQARALMVLTESLAAIVWRHALTWAELAQQRPDMALLKSARAAAKQVQDSLFDIDWRKIGGVEPKYSAIKNNPSLPVLLTLTRESIEKSMDVLTACPNHRMRNRPHHVDEETPHTLTGGTGHTLRDYFKAQMRYGYDLIDEAMSIQNGASSAGTVQTARGNLVHHVTLAGDHITHWQTVAPTDINFAPNGAAAHQLTGISDERLARWIIAAYDPCRPFVFKRSAQNA